MSTWAPSLSPRLTARCKSPDRVLATAADFRDELLGFAKGPLSDVVAERTREQLDGFLAGPLRAELRGLEERLRGSMSAIPRVVARSTAQSGTEADAGPSIQAPSGGVVFGGHGGKRASVMLQSSPHTALHATSWITKRRISTLVKQTALRRRTNSNVKQAPLADVRHSDNPSYTGMPLLEDDEEEGARTGSTEACSEWPFDSDGFYDSEVEAREKEKKEEEERIAKASIARGRAHAQHRAHEMRASRMLVAAMVDDVQEPTLPPAPPQPQMSMKWVRKEFYPWAFAVVQSAAFEYTSCAAVLINSLLLGIETDYLAKNIHEANPSCYQAADSFLCVFFFFELLARIAVHGKVFFCGETSMLNIFDTVLVSFQVIDEIISYVHIHTNTGILLIRNLRIIRFLRILRLTRVLAFIGELRTLLVSIASSMKSLVWVVVLLGVLTYSFGIFLTHVVISARLQNYEEGQHWEGEEHLLKWYGSVVTSMLSLFEAVSEGVHWSEAMDPLATYVSPWLTVAFLAYIIFAIFALLNVVTGLFVEAAIATATEDKKMILCQQMCQMFVDCDDDNSGTVSWEEWKHHLDNPQMENYLKELDIDKYEAPLLFHLLDGDGSGEIEAEELVGGCLRLHGAAKALELAALIHEFRGFSKQWCLHANRIEEALNLAPMEPAVPVRRISSMAAGHVPGFGRMTATAARSPPNGSSRLETTTPRTTHPLVDHGPLASLREVGEEESPT